MDMKILSQTLIVKALISELYITMHKQKVPIYKLSRSEAPKTQQIYAYRHARKSSGLFYGRYRTGRQLSSRNNFPNVGFCCLFYMQP